MAYKTATYYLQHGEHACQQVSKNFLWSSPYRCVAKTAMMLVNMKKRMREFRPGRMEDVRADRRGSSDLFH